MTFALLGLLACAGAGDSADGPCDGPPVTWNNFAHGFMTTYCQGCHSVHNTDLRYGAPEGVDFDTEEDTVRWAARVRARALEDLDMPVGGGVYDDDLALLERYLTCTLAE